MTEERLLDSDDDIEEEATPKRRENSTIRQLREAQEAAAKERDEARERAERAERAVLTNSGLTEKQQAAFQAMGYTIDQVDTFRSEVLGVTEEVPEAEPQDEAVEDESEEEEVPVATLHSPTPTGAGTPKGSKGYTSNELLELMQQDPAKADKVLRSGKVIRKEFNPGGPRF